MLGRNYGELVKSSGPERLRAGSGGICGRVGPPPERETGFAKAAIRGKAAHPQSPAREAVAWALLDDIPACAVTLNRKGDPDVDHR